MFDTEEEDDLEEDDYLDGFPDEDEDDGDVERQSQFYKDAHQRLSRLKHQAVKAKRGK